jgi:hypothetical protein
MFMDWEQEERELRSWLARSSSEDIRRFFSAVGQELARRRPVWDAATDGCPRCFITNPSPEFDPETCTMMCSRCGLSWPAPLARLFPEDDAQ